MVKLVGLAVSVVLLFGLVRHAWRVERGNAPEPVLIGPSQQRLYGRNV